MCNVIFSLLGSFHSWSKAGSNSKQNPSPCGTGSWCFDALNGDACTAGLLIVSSRRGSPLWSGWRSALLKAKPESDGSQRPAQIASPNSKPCVAGTFLDTCAFQDPPLGSFESAGRNTILGPGMQMWDLSILRDFRMGERVRLRFRTQVFNTPNHANVLFTAPGLNAGNSSNVLGAPQLGYLTPPRPARQIQFGLKLYY